MPSLNPDIRRAAAEQLLTLTPDLRFAIALSEPPLLLAIHQALISACADPGSEEQLQHVVRDTALEAEQQIDMPNMQLPIACLHLLAGIVQHCLAGKSLVLQEADR